ncbi:MAG: transglutaminase domain-containing protein, partial [Myxococcales bacterium]|nr:transglutaminase domain-containing protein [Myxococcales bacterium]
MRIVSPAVLAVAVLFGRATAAPPISVQVEQSAYRLIDIADGPLEVTVRVKNQGLEAAENVILRVPGADAVAESGVTATREGDALLWPVGTLPPGDVFTVHLSLAPAGEGQALAAPQARAVYAGTPARIAGRAVQLYGPAFPVEYLLPTPDADPTDPAIAHQAGLLGQDPQRIFAFVRDEVVAQPYVGSLQGARGALYAQGGNAHDRANLLVALLRAAGVPAGYRFATLDDAALDRLEAGFWPSAARMDQGGGALDLDAVRQRPEGALHLLDPATAVGLGATRGEQAAALSALDDEALSALLLEGRTLDAALRERLRDHCFVEAYVNGAFVPLDPSFPDAGFGVGIVDGGDGALIAAMPEARRHHVALRVVPEEFQQVWQRGIPEDRAPAINLVRGAGDLVGRTLTATTQVDIAVSAGAFLFYTRTLTYTPKIELADLERFDALEVLEGRSFQEIATNFAGPLVNNTLTALRLDIELLAPGQQPGEGEVISRPIADRIPYTARNGLPYQGEPDDFANNAVDSTDATALVIGAPMPPARLTRQAQTALRGQLEAMRGVIETVQGLPNDGDIDAEDHGIVVGFQGQLAATMALLHGSQLADRSALAAQHLRQRVYSDAPRIVAGYVRTRPDATTAMGIDLIRERIESVGAPGQLRADRQRMRMSHGMLATTLEGMVIEAFGGETPLSVNRVVSEAVDAGVEFVLLIGPAGLTQLDSLALPAEASLRIRQALQAGKSVLAPTAPVEIDDLGRAAWYELEPDGGLIGRLDDGTGGAMLEYGLKVYQVVCTFIDGCPQDRLSPMRFDAGMIKFGVRLFGIVGAAFQGVAACAGGVDYVCDKLSTTFPAALDQALSLTFTKLSEEIDPFSPVQFTLGNCDAALPTLEGILSNFLDFPYLGPGVQLIEGWCDAVKAYKETYTIIIQALADPIVEDRPSGLMADSAGGPPPVATTAVDLDATLAPAPLRGVVHAGHVRVSHTAQSQLDWTVAAGRQTVRVRALEADPAAIGALGGVTLAWQGIDVPIELHGGGTARLVGAGPLDVYGGPGGLQALATFGEPLARPGDAWLTLSGAPAGATFDLRPTVDVSPVAAGLLEADGDPLGPDRFVMAANAFELRGAFAGPLAAAEATDTLVGAALRFTDAESDLQLGATPLRGDGIGLANATGTITFRPGDPRIEADLDLAAVDHLALSATPSPAGPGPHRVDVAAQTSLAGAYTLIGHAPTGWAAKFEGTTLVLTPAAGTPGGHYDGRIEARGPDGLGASIDYAVDLVWPAGAEATLALVEDPRRSIDAEGVRFPAFIAELRHL